MPSKINDLAYNQRLSILAIHLNLPPILKTLIKSVGYMLSPINIISGHYRTVPGYFGFGMGGLKKGFAKLSTSVGMGTYKHLRINPPLRLSHA